ncbi:MAG: phage tail protein [Marmoricola sp.]
MDVQGSQYHLLAGRADWGRCTDASNGEPLTAVWADSAPGLAVSTSWEYDDEQRALRLERETPLFRRAGRNDPIPLDTRRGADRDSYGNWFWIDEDRTAIRTGRAKGAASTWWSVADLGTGCTCAADGVGAFTSTCSCSAPDLTLQGLCATSHHYLLAGYTSPDENGLLVFDLQGGGTPLRMIWPSDLAFDPSDLAGTPDGGALVLDRTNAAYWRLDDHLRLRGSTPTRPIGFGPVSGGDPIVVSGAVHPSPTPLVDEDSQPVHAISIEPGPGGSVLVMDDDEARGYSILFCYDDDVLRWQSSLQDVVEVVDPADPTSASFTYSVRGHDFVYAEDAGPLSGPLLYVADAEGDQVIALELDPATGVLHPKDDFLPLRRWNARALVRAGSDVWYDFGEHWISLQVFSECRFATSATLTTATDFGPLADPSGRLDTLAGDTFDSATPGCVWHRLFLDAHVPNGTSVQVRARASDDPALLLLENWLTQPVPYLRSDGPELPWADPWADWRRDPRNPKPLPAGMGTHELLFQQVRGRYLQLEITMTGGGRATPLLRSLRAWFARFSYPEHYLPAVYAEKDEPTRFLERFLANFEGIYTALEERIEHSHLILEPRTTPARDLPWLACWFGLALDPLWDESRRRFLIRHVDRFYRMRGTVAGVVATLRVYLDPVVDESVFCVGSGAGGVRVVERFLTRDTGGARYGAPEGSPDLDVRDRVRQAAHRFDVLVPVGLDADQTAMVQRIVESSKPGHTAFSLLRYFELFVVGQARLGLDTELGHGAKYVPMLTGSTSIAAGYLDYPYPFDLTDRVVSDRDRVGALPAL